MELLKFIIALEGAGQWIILLIGMLFATGLLILLWNLLIILHREKQSLAHAINYFAKNTQIGDVEQLKNSLRENGVQVSSAVYNRIEQVINIRENQGENKGEIDQDALSAIAVGKQSLKGEWARHFAGAVIILGLVGTLWGLTEAVIEVQPLITDIEQLDDLAKIANIIRETLAGMSTAFATTLAGLIAALTLGPFSLLFDQKQTSFLADLEEFTTTILLPRFQLPVGFDSLQNAMNDIKRSASDIQSAMAQSLEAMQEAIQKLTEAPWEAWLGQQDTLTEELKLLAAAVKESVADIDTFKYLIEMAVTNLQKSTQQSNAQLKQAFDGLSDTLKQSLPELDQKQQEFERVISSYQDAQAGFMDKLSQNITLSNETLVNSVTTFFQNIQKNANQTTSQQQKIVDELNKLSNERLKEYFDEQNQILNDNSKDITEAISQLVVVAETLNETKTALGILSENLGNLSATLAPQADASEYILTGVQDAIERMHSGFEQAVTKIVQSANSSEETIIREIREKRVEEIRGKLEESPKLSRLKRLWVFLRHPFGSKET